MGKILIENYRGFDIEFDTTCEKFQCVCTDEHTKESTSFTAVKKFVDDYKKANQDFVPFWIDPMPGSYKKERLKVIGVRKDGRFISENTNGNKDQISDYDLDKYMLSKFENDSVLDRLSKLEAEEEIRMAEYRETRQSVISELNITTLKDYKKSLFS